VPALRIKKDAMPDRITETFITGTETGSFPIVCTELCGAGHAYMRSNLVIGSDADFRSWIGSQKAAAAAGAAAPADPLASGRAAFNTLGCNACHVLADAGAQGQVGPALDGFGARAGGIVAGQSAEAYTRAAIVKPGEYISSGYPANVMPADYAQRASGQEIDDLVTYLLEQK